MTLFANLLACAAIIFIGASLLTRYADVLAEKLKLSRSWIGIVLLAAITSLPELSNSFSAVAVVRNPDLGVGNLIGACLMNLLLLVCLDFVYKKKTIYAELDFGHMLSAGFGVILLAVVGLGIMLSPYMSSRPFTFFLFIIYLAGQKRIFAFEKGKAINPEKAYLKEKASTALIRFLALGAVVVAAGVWLSMIGENLAVQTGLGATFVGSIMLSIITTLPELTVSLSALRLGAPDMAVSNLLGSVLFNIAIISLLDPFNGRIALLGAVSLSHVLTCLAGIICLGIVLLSIVKSPKSRPFGFSINSALIAAVIAGCWYLLFKLRGVL